MLRVWWVWVDGKEGAREEAWMGLGRGKGRWRRGEGGRKGVAGVSHVASKKKKKMKVEWSGERSMKSE